MATIEATTELTYTDGRIKRNYGRFRTVVINSTDPIMDDTILTLEPSASKVVTRTEDTKFWNIFTRQGTVNLDVVSSSGSFSIPNFKQLMVNMDIDSITITNTSTTDKASVRVLTV